MNSIITPRNCEVWSNVTRLQAYSQISEWVREQAVAIGNINVENTSRRLLEYWDKKPQYCFKTEFRKVCFRWVTVWYTCAKAVNTYHHDTVNV